MLFSYHRQNTLSSSPGSTAIALALGKALGVPGTPFYLAVAYGAAANFITPFGHQTNLMVYGPGGYRFKDFMKAGLPLKIICAIIAIGGLSLVYEL